jgi:hypothetical protein
MMEYIPRDLRKRLPDFHSYYYDVGNDEVCVVKPVPAPKVILERFRAKFDAMRPKRRVFVI